MINQALRRQQGRPHGRPLLRPSAPNVKAQRRGRTTTNLWLSHTATHRRCSPVRCSAWFGGGLKEVTIDIKGAVKHPQDIYIAVGLDEIGNSVMSIEENPNVL